MKFQNYPAEYVYDEQFDVYVRQPQIEEHLAEDPNVIFPDDPNLVETARDLA